MSFKGRVAAVAVVVTAAMGAIGGGVAQAAVGDNPAGVACTVAQETGIAGLQVTAESLSSDGLINLREIRNGDDSWLRTIDSPGIGLTSIGLDENDLADGYIARYRIGGEVFNVVCDFDGGDEPQPPAPAPEPAPDVECTLVAGDEFVNVLVDNPVDGERVNLRVREGDDSRWLANIDDEATVDIDPNADLFLVVRSFGTRAEVPCTLVQAASHTCSVTTANDGFFLIPIVEVRDANGEPLEDFGSQWTLLIDGVADRDFGAVSTSITADEEVRALSVAVAGAPDTAVACTDNPPVVCVQNTGQLTINSSISNARISIREGRPGDSVWVETITVEDGSNVVTVQADQFVVRYVLNGERVEQRCETRNFFQFI